MVSNYDFLEYHRNFSEFAFITFFLKNDARQILFINRFVFSDHDDLLNFEIGDGEYADGTLNEDELLLSDEGENRFESRFRSG